MIRKTIQIGDPRLTAENKKIEKFEDPELRKLVDDLTETMREASLIGIAAPQIAQNWQVFVTEPRETKTRTAEQADELRVFINPTITWRSEEEVLIWEGCGSFAEAKVFGPVVRPKEITIEAWDINGKKFRLSCNGLLARVIQHEYDHLEGIMFTQRMKNIGDLVSAEFYASKVKGQPELAKADVVTKKLLEFI